MCNPSGFKGTISLGIVQNIYRNVPRCCCYCSFLFLSLLAVLIIFVLVIAAAVVVVTVLLLLLLLLYIHFLCFIQQENILLKLIWVLLSLRHDVGFFAR